jgi:PKD repeat protein
MGLLFASAALSLATPILPTIPATNFNVTSFNAVGDGTTDNTTAIQAAINAASAAGGGTVEIPAGTYLSGPLTLASSINLQIDSGATLMALPVAAFTNYPAQNQPYPNLIYASGMTDLEISGSGTIDGQGAAWWTAPSSGNLYKNRSYMIFFNGNCQRVWIHGVTLQNPPKMHIVFKGVDSDITIDGITINTQPSPNTDGIDLVGTHCLVQNSTINAGDDNIALGSSSASAVSTDILITNCTFGIGHGVSIGSNTYGGVSNLTVVACTFNGTDYGIRMKSSDLTSGGSGQGGVAQNLSYSNITMTNIVHGAIVIYSYYGSGGIYGTPDNVTPFGASTQKVDVTTVPIWRNITISNVTASVASGGIAGIVWGRMEVPVTNLTFCNVNISASKPFSIYSARAVQLIDSQITVPGTTNAVNLFNANVTVTNSVPGGNPITLGGLAIPPTNNTLAFFNAQAAITDTNMLDPNPYLTLGGSTLTVSNNLNLGGAATLNFGVGTNATEIAVAGNLTLGGTLNIADAGGFTANTYTLFTYGGTLTTNGSPGILSIGTTPDPTMGYTVDISSSGVVNLITFFVLPVAGFDASPTNGVAPLTVSFVDSSTGTITNRHWDFGDETTTDTVATSVVHTYNVGGTNTVQLIVSGPGGSSTNTQVNAILVAPPCNFTLSATNASFGVTGGGGAITVTTYTTACVWTAGSNVSWIQIAGGGVSTGGAASVTYSVLPNITSSSSRMGTMTIASQTFTVTEDGDPIAPTVALTAPTSGYVSNTIAVSATAADNIAVVNVEFYRDGGVLLDGVTTAPYSMNFDTTALADGPHCFYAKAYDAANNVGNSSTNCVTVDNNAPTVPAGLTATGVATNQIDLSWSPSTDSGSGVAGYQVFRDGTQIATTAGTSYPDVGLATGTEHCYRVAAYDHIGRVSAPSAEVCAQSLATVALLLGSYNGLIIQTNAPSQASSGSFKLTLSKTGSFAASVALGGAKAVAFAGRFDAAGNATNSVTRPGQNPLQVVLHLDLSGSDQIIGTVSDDDTFTSELLADRAAYSHKNRCPLAGTFTAVLHPPGGDETNLPQGYGYGTLTVTTSGQGRLAGVLGDGTKVSVTVPLSKHGTWPLYQALYNKGGASIGWVTIDTNNTVDATVDWFRPKMPSPYFPAGFTTNVTLLGQKYVRPVDITPSSAGVNGLITLGGGNLESNIVKTVFVYATGKVTVLSANNENVQMKFQPTAGQFSGSFIHPSLNTTIKFTGLALEFRGDAAGYFLGTNESGFVTFEPTP